MRRAIGPVLALAVLAIPAFAILVANAQRPPRRAIDLKQLGDGAAACAAGKIAMAARAPREARSVASTNFDITYYHLDLTSNRPCGRSPASCASREESWDRRCRRSTLDLAAP